jgi:hypothetical protein
LNEAMRALLTTDANVPLIAINKGMCLMAAVSIPGRVHKRQDGLALGPGAFVAGLECVIYFDP